MDTQDLSTSISRTACKAATSKSASWTARTLSRVAGKLSHRYLSCHAQVLTQDRDCEPIIEFQPTFQTQGSLKRGHRQQGLSFADLDTWAFDNEGCDLLRCGDDVFLENGGADGYGYYDYEDETHFSQDETSEAVYDDLPDFLDEETPKLTLTTPEGEIIIGDAIPEGTKCYFSDGYHALQKQRLDTLENSLVPGNWKQIRDLNRPQEPEADYAEDEALRVEERKQKRRAERAERRARDKERQRRRHEAVAAERTWQLQRMKAEYDEQERRYLDEERRYQAQQPQMRQTDADFEKWIEDMDRQQEEGERRLQEVRDELEGADGEDQN